MGEIRKALPPAKLIFGLLAADEAVRRECLERLAAEFGPIDLETPLEPFLFTRYYCEEMGEAILRQYLSIGPLIDMGELPRIKHRTNALEEELALTDESGRKRRRVNIDPGYVAAAKMVLATTKDYAHRIYVADGIFAEVTLHYQRQGGFAPYPWTYRDYARPEVCAFFNAVRETYLGQLREAGW